MLFFAFDMGKEALMTGEEKKAYLEGCVDTLIICPFTEAIREMEAEEFIEKILIEQLHAAIHCSGNRFSFWSSEARRYLYAETVCKALWI